MNMVRTPIQVGLLSLAAWGCHAPESSQTKIYGGTKVAPGAWPTTVALVLDGSVYCSGSAIHPSVIVTAAHCTRLGLPDRWQVYAGDGIDGGRISNAPAVTRVVSSPKFSHDEGGWNDIGYMVLEQPLDLPSSAFVPALTDPAEIEALLQVGSPAHLVGFGNRDNDGGGFGLKYEVDVNLTSVGANEIAMGGDGRDSCNRDSGGPAFAQLPNGEWRLFGVTSRGGACGSGGIYGRLDANICWIQEDSGIDLGLNGFC